MTQAVYSITDLNVSTLESNPPILAIRAQGETSTSGWSGFKLVHRVYVTPPADGIYEADLVGMPPGGFVPQVITPFSHSEFWKPFPDDLRGLKVNASTNSMTSAGA